MNSYRLFNTTPRALAVLLFLSGGLIFCQSGAAFTVIKNVNSGAPLVEKLVIFDKARGAAGNQVSFVVDNCPTAINADGAIQSDITGNQKLSVQINWKPSGDLKDTFDATQYDYVLLTCRFEGGSKRTDLITGKVSDLPRAGNLWFAVELFDKDNQVVGYANLADANDGVTPATTVTLKIPMLLFTSGTLNDAKHIKGFGYNWGTTHPDQNRDYHMVIDKIALAVSPFPLQPTSFMNFPRILTGLALTLALSTNITVADRVTPDYAKQNLDLVPDTDPAATNAPQLLPALKGVHPRLLYTQADIDALKAKIASDPILKETYDANLTWAKRAKAPPYNDQNPPSMVYDDTSAIASAVQRYAGLAYYYSLDHDPATKQGIVDILTMMLNQPYWADTAELDSSMGGACNMLMVAILYDAVYNDLDPEFRAKMGQKILTHARRLYYLGFQQKCLIKNKYWQQDPQPNHRWYRIAGEMGCLLVIADEPTLKTDYLLQEMKKEVDFVMKWYPPDGDCHEGAGYQTFGFSSILRAASMMDRDLGTTYLKDTGLKNAWAQQVYYQAPDGGSQMSFGDDMNSPGPFSPDDAAFLACPALLHDPNVQAMMKRYFESKRTTADPKRPYVNPWSVLEFYDPTVGDGDYKAVPTNRLFADLGAASLRDTWEPDATAFTFKCGPYGGYKLNEYRQAYADKYGNGHYVNVAHDDPESNSFSMTIGGDFMFHPGLYSLHKLTETANTITVDGKGQINEGTDFMQPVDGVDMRTLAYLTGWKQGDGGRTIIEGEAGKAYIGMDFKQLYDWQYPETVQPPSPPGTPPPPPKVKNPITGPIKQPPPPVLKRFRRTAIWMPGEYVLVLDDIRGDGAHDIMWHGTVEDGNFDNPAQGLCHTASKDGKTQVPFQILADKDFNGALDYKFLDGRFGSQLMKQFQFSLKTDAVKFACLFDPWKKKPTMTLSESGDVVTLKVHSDSFDDTWTWTGAKDDTTPSSIQGTRAGAPLMALTEKDKAPTE